ncbi:MAG: preprotein translocase subunit SecG, partial [Kiritimatiellae bacterium]|nr:preprotein translocase subunit SecG [Kiritimatiellia bacterium]
MTSFFIGLLYVVEVIVCLLLALVVMLQKPKEGGLGGAIGGGMGEAVFGADASNVLIKVTIWLGTIFLVTTLLLARLTSVGHSRASIMDSVAEPAPSADTAAPAPAAPASAARATNIPLPEPDAKSEPVPAP